MRMLRFNIASLLVIIFVLGVSLAALRESSDLWESGLFTVTLGILRIGGSLFALLVGWLGGLFSRPLCR
ncbi:MAG: hypothetical protein ACHRXM_15835 [Isosphaerales bacterium]